jgi:hypothetical protein
MTTRGREDRRLTWIWLDSIRTATCRGPRCRAAITFATNCRTGRAMPYTGRLEILQTRLLEVEGQRGTWRQAGLVDLAQAHFASCPDYKPRTAFNAPRRIWD